MRIPYCPAAPSPAPRKTPWTAPAASTWATPPPGPDPRRTYDPDHLAEPLHLHTDLDEAAILARTVEVLETVGLGQEHIDRFPHEFSGGQRQRIGIARALILSPSLVVCDEPVSALDVSVQAQVLDLMKQLQADLGLTYVFISHDLSVVEMMADEIVVMSQGRIVEQGTVQQIFRAPQHPYTKALLAAIPVADPAARVDRAARRAIVERGVAASGPSLRIDERDEAVA